ncbi:MAG: aminotransferase class IV [Bacteroidota bacterium]
MAFLSAMQALLNGKWVESTAGSIPIDDRGFRYGSGLFETIRFEGETSPLWDRHMDRLTRSLQNLQWQMPALFTTEKLNEDVIRVIRKNRIKGSVRVRITVTHGQGGLFDGDRKLNFLIEAWSLDPARKEFNTNGWVIGVYKDARKSIDTISVIKSTSGLAYTQAAQYAKQEKWNDALLLNTNGDLADSCIANLFLVRGGELFTTDVNQGAVGGVMQSWLIDQLSPTQPVHRGAINITALQEADEVFLTNALFGIRWVGRIGDKVFDPTLSQDLYRQYIRTIFP